MAGELSSQSAGSWLSSAAPLIGAGINFVNGLGSSLFSANQARKNRAFQERMYNKQVEDNIRLWNMQNEYNLPKNVLARMEEAGINPLAYFNSQGTSLTSSSAAQGGNAPSGAMAHPALAGDFASAATQAALMKAQIANINADTETKLANAKGQNILNDVNEATKHIQIAMKYGENDQINENIRYMASARFNEAVMTAENINTMASARLYQFEHLKLDTQQIGQQWLLGLYNVELGKGQLALGNRNASIAEEANKIAWRHVINETHATDAQVGVLIKTAARMQLENDILSEQKPYKIMQQKYQTNQDYWRAVEGSWMPILRESGLENDFSNRWLQSVQRELMNTEIGEKEMNMMLKPVDLLYQGGYKPFKK